MAEIAAEIEVEVIDLQPELITVETGYVNTESQISVSRFVVGEVPAGAINGQNVTFQTLNDFVPETVSVCLNGFRLTIINDYLTQGYRTLILNDTPGVGENLVVDYIKRN